MAEKNYIEAIEGLLNELKQITQMALSQSGVKQTTDLSKSVEYVVTKDGVNMLVASYYPFVSNGRRANIRRVPIANLIEFIKKNNIRPRGGQTINQLAWAIQTSIYRRGIKGKKFEDKVATGVADYTAAALADELALLVAEDLVEMFAPVAV